MVGPQVPLQRLEFLAVLQTDDVVRRNGPANRHSRLLRFLFRFRRPTRHSGECGVHVADQSCQILAPHIVVADVG